MQGGTHRRRCTQKADCGHRRSHVIEGAIGKAVYAKGGAHTRATGKAVHTKGAMHKRRSVATAGVMLLKGPQARRYTQKAVHTKGGL